MIKIEDMPAGSDMDRAVAERVMLNHAASEGSITAKGCIGTGAWSPSTNIAHAWEVVEHITKGIEEAKDGDIWLDGLGYRCCDDDTDGAHGRWRCMFTCERDGKRVETFATADTAPLAICRAALKAVIG